MCSCSDSLTLAHSCSDRSFVVVSAMFGFFLSAWSVSPASLELVQKLSKIYFLTRCAVTPPALVEILGVELLTSAFGTLTFVRGVAALIGIIMIMIIIIIILIILIIIIIIIIKVFSIYLPINVLIISSSHQNDHDDDQTNEIAIGLTSKALHHYSSNPRVCFKQ